MFRAVRTGNRPMTPPDIVIVRPCLLPMRLRFMVLPCPRAQSKHCAFVLHRTQTHSHYILTHAHIYTHTGTQTHTHSLTHTHIYILTHRHKHKHIHSHKHDVHNFMCCARGLCALISRGKIKKNKTYTFSGVTRVARLK